jgi:hypothetical protein
MSKARDIADGIGGTNPNLIINGNLAVWQRGISSTSTGWGYHTADRWNTNLRDGAGTMSQYDMGAELRPFTYALKTAITSAATSSPAIQQKIEDSRKFKNQTVTFSFYAKASKAITVDTYFNLIWANTDNTTTAQSNSITTSWEKFTLTSTLPDPSGSYNSTYDNLICRFDLPISDTYDFYITGVKLELGDKATDFEHRSYGDELARCQRYYQRTHNTHYASGSYGGQVMDYPVFMRATPTVINTGLQAGLTTTQATNVGANGASLYYFYHNSSGYCTCVLDHDAEL